MKEDFQAIPFSVSAPGTGIERGKVFAALKDIEDDIQKTIRVPSSPI